VAVEKKVLGDFFFSYYIVFWGYKEMYMWKERQMDVGKVLKLFILMYMTLHTLNCIILFDGGVFLRSPKHKYETNAADKRKIERERRQYTKKNCFVFFSLFLIKIEFHNIFNTCERGANCVCCLFGVDVSARY
jgi:hypothetical protein